MKKLLPILIPIFVVLIYPFDIFASGLEVSKSSSFATGDLNFTGGEKVYVRVSTDKNGSVHVLNIKDNNYSTISSINLNKDSSGYTASFSAPGAEGYYSLEANIEGSGTSITSVKTIKVGSPAGAKIKVNVNSSVKGTSVNKSESPHAADETEVQDEDERSEEPDKMDEADEPEATAEVEVFNSNEQREVGSGNWIWATVKGILDFIWPF